MLRRVELITDSSFLDIWKPTAVLHLCADSHPPKARFLHFNLVSGGYLIWDLCWSSWHLDGVELTSPGWSAIPDQTWKQDYLVVSTHLSVEQTTVNKTLRMFINCDCLMTFPLFKCQDLWWLFVPCKCGYSLFFLCGFSISVWDGEKKEITYPYGIYEPLTVFNASWRLTGLS